jgi:hypothetical protein
VIKNRSRFPIDIVWENAQDLEHVAFLHSRTNKEFHLLYAGKGKDSAFEYDIMIYRAKRRLLYFFSFQSFGFRKIIADYNIRQVEYIPLFGTTSSLNSLLFKTDDPEYPTLMLDEVVMEVPWVLVLLKGLVIRLLRRHTRIQCSEDEPFRERRALLRLKGIKLPYRIFNESAWERLCLKFEEQLQC